IDIVSDYVALKQTGRNFLGLCPFHHEKTPSFTVNVEKQIYKCFGCGEGGTVFNFLMKQEALTFPEAVKMLAEKANIRIDTSNTKEKSQGTSTLYEVNEKTTCFFTDMLLKTKDGKRSRDYVSSRLINDDSIRKFRLGYAPNRWDSIVNKSKEWGVNTQILEKAGLVISKQDKACYDRFRNRLMFPIFDSQNRPGGFGARALDESLPKYLNSPETPVFNKSKTLYGVNLAKESMNRNRKVLLMEGYTDVIMAHQHGIDWSIAALGTALTREHVRFLRRYCDRAILVFDADKAGQKSSERNLDIFIEEDFDVNVVLLPKNYDPYDFLVKNGKQSFLEQVENAYDFFSFKIKLSETKWDMASVSGRTSAIDDILSTAVKIPNFVKRELA
ncbi:MAG: DNA primase, partial [Candidatus Thermoplasmatota archaeon]|nr:DNA primase [Candidatus Thermoplasmatota archaeon]